MVEPLPGLVQGDALKAVFKRKSKAFDEDRLTATTKKGLQLKLEAAAADGWSLLKRNNKSVKVKRDKPEDRKLEDDVWCLFYRMGFKELNEGRTFSIKVGTAPPRQLDIFAKDDETVFIVECTHAKDTGPKSVKSLIDKIQANRGDLIQAIHAHYGKEPKLKVKFAIATRNIVVRQADMQRAADAKIPILTGGDLEYFFTLTAMLKTAARYQFLARYLQGEGVDGLRQEVAATRGQMGGTKFYSFLMSPYDLLKISYVSHRSRTGNDDIDTYQRLVKPNRLKQIGQYIDSGGKFPTNIVINLRTSDQLRFDPKGEKFGETQTGTLYLPALYGSAWIIDGQHRLYGYAYSERTEERDKAVLPVLAFENMDAVDEIDLFLKINHEQVKVSTNLMAEIVAGLNIDDPDPRERLKALCAQTVMLLDGKEPFRGRIKTEADKKTHLKCLSVASFVAGLAENALVGTAPRAKTGDISPGLLMDPKGKSKPTLSRAQAILIGYFGLFATEAKAHWDKGEAKGGYLATNLGTRALLLLLKKVTAFLATKDDLKYGIMEPEEIVEKISAVVKPLVEYFKNARDSDVEVFRTSSSKHGVTLSCLAMMELIHKAKPEFDPQEVKDFIQARDKEGTEVARDLISKIEDVIFEDVISRLESHYGKGEKNFWMKGVPVKVRQDCDKRYNEKPAGERERWHELMFSEYSEIIGTKENWPIFEEHYNFRNKNNRSDALEQRPL